MADNRIFILNTITNKFLCIGKRLGGPWYLSPRSPDLKNYFEDEENEKSFFDDEHCYTLVYEDDEMFYTNNKLKNFEI